MTSLALPLRRLAASAVACCAFAAAAAEPPIVVKKVTGAGQEVLVRGFAEFDAACNLVRVQTVAIASAPARGSVETRPGNVVVGPNWVGGGHCEGTTLRGVQVFYIPAPGFTGTDRFALDVGYSRGRTVRAEVEVRVR
jgi:hypothetical protein